MEFSGVQGLLHNLTLGEQWLTQMAEAAQDAGIYIQYCMSNPRHAMQSLLYPMVTQVTDLVFIRVRACVCVRALFIFYFWQGVVCVCFREN